MTPAAGSDDYDLDLLDDHLGSSDLPDEAMLLSELDGYLTAIALAPRLIPPSEWLPRIWGGAGLPFAGAAEAGAALGAVTGLYNDNLRALADDRAAFEPIFEVDRDGSLIPELWAQGFVRGVALRLDDWQPLIEDEVGLGAFTVIAALAPDQDGNYMPEVAEKQRRRLSRQAGSLFPESVAAMRLFWRQRGLAPSAPPGSGRTVRSTWLARRRDGLKGALAERPTRKVGRNDPCPCGSGKKYKRCCGA
jgi:uncharacterized protein